MRSGTDALAKAEHLDPVFLLNFPTILRSLSAHRGDCEAMRIPLHLVVALPTLLLALPTHTFSCQHTAAGVTYDFSRLSGLRSVNKHSPTPPTTSEAQVQMDLCGPSGVPRENDIADEDQVGNSHSYY